MRLKKTFTLLACLATALFTGCGGRSEAVYIGRTVPVTGKVMFKGQPLTAGSITFDPEDIGREAHGLIRPDGTFTMTTFTENDGVMPGEHRIALSHDARAGKLVPPMKYRNPSSSQVTVEVTAEKTDYFVNLD